MPDFSNGSEFAGHRIDGEIKRGGMGVVYRATDLRLKRTVALKVIAPELARGDDFRARFEREWSVAAAIDHPNVIPVFHAGEEDGVLYTTMLLVDGMDLGDLIAERGPLPLSVAANVVAQIGEGLDAAHEHGLIHRDVKPANILLRDDGRGGYRAYLSDFGLTKRVDGRTALTMSGMFVGTVDYIAPEQLLGAQIDARTDVYSLGCVFFHALAGFAPYRADSDWATLKGHEGGDIPAPTATRPDLPPQVDAVIERALAKSPEDRFPSAGDLGRAALAAAAEESVKVPEASVATGEAAQGVTAPGVPLPTATGQAPPAPPSDSGKPAPGGERKDRKPLLIGAAAVIAAVLVVGALALAGVFGGGGSGGSSQPPDHHHTPSDKPTTAALTVAQVEAAATLHEPYRRSCKPAESDESVECKVKSYAITLTHFNNVAEMRKHFLGAVSELSHGTCENDWDVRGTWYNGDPNSPQGLLACYENVSNEPTVAWTNDTLLVEGFMTSANPGSRRSLYESWQEDTTD